jgi:hypothetical protein
MTRWVIRVPTPSPPLVTPVGIALSDPKKAEGLAESLDSQVQPVNNPPYLAVIEKVAEVFQAYSYARTREPKLTNPIDVQDAIRGLEVGKAPGPNGLLNRALKYFPQRAICLLTALFNTAFLEQYFPRGRKARVFSILKLGKDPSLPSSYWPFSLIGTIGKLFEN